MSLSINHIHKRISLLSIVILEIIATSCGVSKKMPAGPSPSEIIQIHYRNRDWMALFDDINTYPEYHDSIKNKIINKFDYSNYEYSTLQQMANRASNDFETSAFFDSLLFSRQAAILDTLAQMDLAETALFYKDNYRNYDFLRQAIQDSYLIDIEDLDYVTVKNLHNAFLGTDISPLVEPSYTNLRNNVLVEVNTGLDTYFEQEKGILSDIEFNIREKLDPYVEKGVQNIVVGMSEKLDRGLFKKVFHREDQDRYSAFEYYSKLVSENFDSDYISNTVLAKVSDYISTTTSLRKEYIQDYMTDHNTCNSYYIPKSIVDSLSFILQISSEDASNIQSLKTTGVIISAASVALMFTPAGWIGAAVDAADLINGVTEDSRISKMIDSMASNIYSDTASCINRYLNNVFGILRQRREQTQDYLRNRINNEI